MPPKNFRPAAVLIVAADPTLRGAMARVLGSAAHRVELADNDRRAREIISRGGIDVIILAAGQLGTAGQVLARELRDSHQGLVIVSERAGDTTGLSTATLSTVIPLVLPLNERELLDRVTQAQTSSLERDTPRSDLLCFEGCTLDVDGRAFLDAQGRVVPLTPAEFALLFDLARNSGRVRSREQLRAVVAGEALEAYERSVDMHVSRLRRKIERDPRSPKLIVTVPQAGYKFAVRVQRLTAPPPLSERESPVAEAASRPPPERRELTVLDCGLDGIAEIASQHDPDVVQETLTAIRDASVEAIRQYGGVLARFSGDGLVAYFGYPEAHEDDAERAIRAGLLLARAISRTSNADASNVYPRVGIATGTALVGDLALNKESEYAAVGDAPRLAGRLKSVATAGSVVVSSTTRRRAGHSFAFRKIASVPVSYAAEQAPAWRVIEADVQVRRFGTRGKAGLPELAGRSTEMAMLRQRWRQACQGQGQVVVLSGEPGIGKSRLVFEIEQWVGPQRHVRMRFFGSPHHTNSPLFPIGMHLQRAAGFARNDGEGDLLSKLAALLDVAEKAEGLPLLANLLSLRHDRERWVQELSPQRRKEKTFALLRSMSARIAAQQPVLAVFEDVQWYDAASIEFLALEVERVRRLPFMLLITARPEFVPPWPDYAHVTRLSVTRLGHSDAADLIRHSARARVPSAAEVDEIVARADGVPLFLEELTREKLGLDDQISGPRPAREVPATLQGLLLARIDRLDPASKAVAQVGAVIGRSFSYELLYLLGSNDPAKLGRALDQMIAADLVFCHGTPPQANYLFKHALVQDATYGTLANRKRQELHGRVARALEEHFPEIADTQPELLAHHHAEADNRARAVDYLLVAAERALSRSAPVEARTHCDLARELLSTLQPDQNRRELKVQIVLSRVWIATKGHTAPEFLEALQRARALAEALDDKETLALVIYGLWNVAWGAAAYSTACTHAQELLAIGVRDNAPAYTAFGHFVLGSCLMPTGALSAAGQHFEEALRYERIELPGGRLMTWGGAIGRVAAIASLHNCLFLAGELLRADAALREAITEAQNVSQLYARTIALNLICRAHALRRDVASIQDASAEMVRIATGQGYPQFAATSLVFRGWGIAMTGEPMKGLDLALAGVNQCRNLGFQCWLTHHLALLAECQWKAGDPAAARHTLDDAIEQAQRTGERICEAELYRLQGELSSADDLNPRHTARWFEKAIHAAQTHDARLLELRSATSLARQRAAGGRRDDARALLTSVSARFSEESDNAEVGEAIRLLDRLSRKIREPRRAANRPA